MNLTQRQLRGFIGVATSGSFTKTSQRLHQSQAALSAMIRELESQLGCRLFHRSTRSVELTEAGRRFLPVATGIIESLQSAAADLAEIGRQDGVALHVGVTPLVAQSLLPTVVALFRERAPNVSLGISDSSPSELQQLVESSRIDAGFGAFFSKASGLDRHPIFPTRLLLVAKRGRGRTLPPSVPWEFLDGQPLITLDEASPIQQLTEAQITKVGIEPSSRLRVNQLETVIAFAGAGLGIGVVPSFAQCTCKRYDVSIASLTPHLDFHYHRITRAGRVVPASLDLFTSLLAEFAVREMPI